MSRNHNHFRIILAVVLINSVVASQVRGDRTLTVGNDDDISTPKNFTDCRPHGEGYVSPYADIKPIEINSMVNAATTSCVNGKAGGFNCHDVDLEAFINLGTFSSTFANDIWGWTDPQTDKEYALVGLKEGTAFVDISNPSNPTYLGRLDTHSSNSSWRDIKTYDNHAFIVSEANNHGLQVFDLTQLRNVNNPPTTFSETAHLNSFGEAHNIVINEETGLAVAVGSDECEGGLYMIDVTTPSNPSVAGCFSADGYTHDAQCVIYNGPSLAYKGNELCFAFNENTVTIVDVTDRGSPVQLARKTYPKRRYTHQGWLTEDHATLLANDEHSKTSGETFIFDVTDVTNVKLLGSHSASRSSIMHNEYVKGNYVYQSNYGAGLVILDVSGAANGDLEEVGYFDMIDSNDVWDGSWSNYPYFESGIVVATSGSQGLFILRPKIVETTLPPVPAPTPVVAPTPGEVFVRINKFGVRTKQKSNGDNKSRLQFAVKSTEGENGEGAKLTVNFTIGAKATEYKTCTISKKSKCTIRLPAYDPTDEVTVGVENVESDLGEYDPEVNKKYMNCSRVFSSACPTITINN